MKLNYLHLLIFALITMFTACSGGERDDDDMKAHIENLESGDEDKDDHEDDREGNDDKEVWEKEDCFKLIYPLSFIMPDGNTVSGDDEESLKKLIKEWYEVNGETDVKPSLLYPIQLIFDDHLLEVASEEELIEIKKACKEDDKEDWEKEDCFELVYPLSLIMPDGNTISGDDEESLKKLIKEWYEANGETDVKPSLLYPIQLIFDDHLLEVASEEELIEIKKRCKEEYDHEDEDHKDCFEFNYPISYSMPDGQTISGNNAEELRNAMQEWYDTNGEHDQEPSLVLPVDIIFEDGTTMTVSSEEEWIRVEEYCDRDEEDENKEYDCLELRADIGDPCRLDDGMEGKINEDCECE